MSEKLRVGILGATGMVGSGRPHQACLLRKHLLPRTYWKDLSCVRSDVRQALGRRLQIQ